MKTVIKEPKMILHDITGKTYWIIINDQHEKYKKRESNVYLYLLTPPEKQILAERFPEHTILKIKTQIFSRVKN